MRALDEKAEVSLCSLGQFATASYFTAIKSDEEALGVDDCNNCITNDSQNKAFHVVQV